MRGAPRGAIARTPTQARVGHRSRRWTLDERRHLRRRDTADRRVATSSAARRARRSGRSGTMPSTGSVPTTSQRDDVAGAAGLRPADEHVVDAAVGLEVERGVGVGVRPRDARVAVGAGRPPTRRGTPASGTARPPGR